MASGRLRVGKCLDLKTYGCYTKVRVSSKTIMNFIFYQTIKDFKVKFNHFTSKTVNEHSFIVIVFYVFSLVQLIISATKDQTYYVAISFKIR